MPSCPCHLYVSVRANQISPSKKPAPVGPAGRPPCKCSFASQATPHTPPALATTSSDRTPFHCTLRLFRCVHARPETTAPARLTGAAPAGRHLITAVRHARNHANHKGRRGVIASEPPRPTGVNVREPHRAALHAHSSRRARRPASHRIASCCCCCLHTSAPSLPWSISTAAASRRR